jgi:hypothetical protein
MKILISNRQLLQATWPDAINYFLAESIVDFAESIVDFAESITAEAESIVAVAVESTVVAVSAALLQAAKVAAIANTNNTFFIFLIFNCYLNINTEC